MYIKQIGNVILTTPLDWMEYVEVNSIQAEATPTINGGVVVWEQLTDISSKQVTLGQDTDGWQTGDVVDSLITLADASIGGNVTLTLYDDSTMLVRFRHEVSGGSLQFTKVVGVQLCDYYTCTFYFARI